MPVHPILTYDIVTYLLILAMLVFTVVTTIIVKSIKEQNRLQRSRKMLCCIALALLSFTIMVSYYVPRTQAFLMPNDQNIHIRLLQTLPNSSGGITQTNYDMPTSDYASIIDALQDTSLSRQIVDWNKSLLFTIRIKFDIFTFTPEPGSIYLQEMRLYLSDKGKYTSYVIAEKDGRRQTYRINDAMKIKEFLDGMQHNIEIAVYPLK